MNKKNKIFLGKNYIFIFGFPGSGTTIVSKQISKNIDSSLWLEPYFIWREKLINKNFDNFKESEFTDEVISNIRNNFFEFYKKSKKKFLIEKEPRNILNFLIVKKIFPYSKFIFVKKKKSHKNLKTIRRKTRIRAKKSLFQDFLDIYNKLRDQKFLIFQLKLIIYELKNFDRIKQYFNKYFSNSKIEWGLKVAHINKVVILKNDREFKFIVKKINQKLRLLDKKFYIIVKLEDFAGKYNQEIKRIHDFLGIKKLYNSKLIFDKKRILK